MKITQNRVMKKLLAVLLIMVMVVGMAPVMSGRAASAPKTYKITCKSSKNGSTTATFTAVENKTILGVYASKLPKPKEGYYRHWYDCSTGKQILTNTTATYNMAIYPVDKPCSMTATFISNENFDGKGQKWVSTVKTGVRFDSIVTTPTRSGRILLGWSEDKYGETGVYKPEHVARVLEKDNGKTSKQFYGIWLNTTGSYWERTDDFVFILSLDEFEDLVTCKRIVMEDYNDDGVVKKDSLLKKANTLNLKCCGWALGIAATAMTGGTALAFMAGGFAVSLIADKVGSSSNVSSEDAAAIAKHFIAKERLSKEVNWLNGLLTNYKRKYAGNAEIRLEINVYWSGAWDYSQPKRNDISFYTKYMETIVQTKITQ